MRVPFLWLALASVASLRAANPFQPTISPNGVVNAASYLSGSFVNYGIARGSMFLVFGSALGPVDLVQAASFPLPTTDGLAGTRVLVSIGAYNAACPMVYSSLTQVAAILPSNAPEGDGTLVVAYQNQASVSAPIHVVRSAFGTFTRNQAGSGPAIAQNFVSQSSTPLNSLIASATPGQTVILWGTGLGPIDGDETSGPRPGALPYLDSLWVGSQQATVRYAGRSGCCAGVDEVIFDVPAGVAGCYLPVIAVTGAAISNAGTISVNASGKECDDPLSYRAADLLAAERGGGLRIGSVDLSAAASGLTFSAGFYSVPLDALLAGTSRLQPSAGACHLAVARVGDTAAPPGQGLNAGNSLSLTAPIGQLSADNVASGGYLGSKPAIQLAAGSYAFAAGGGSDVGGWNATLNLTALPLWSNQAAYNVASYSLSNPLWFTWSSGDPAGTIAIRIETANAIYNSAVECNVPASAGSFTVPAFLTRAMYHSPATVGFAYHTPAAAFSASGLDVGTIRIANSVSVQTALAAPLP